MSRKAVLAIGAVVILAAVRLSALEWYLPIRLPDRRSWRGAEVTAIGRFGMLRRARPGVPAHRHTGLDLKRPGANYADEPVFPAARGLVISRRDDGPFAQAIIEHRRSDGTPVWTVYEHITGISAAVGDTVDPAAPFARFMTRRELDRYGWQFDHLHFEVMLQRPAPAAPTRLLPSRFCRTYSLACQDQRSLDRYYRDPRTFLESTWTDGHHE